MNGIAWTALGCGAWVASAMGLVSLGASHCALSTQGVRGEAVDDHSARATITDRSHSATMLLALDGAGLIHPALFAARGAMVGKTVVQIP